MQDRFTLRHLEYFIAVAETGSLSAASARLHISAGAISVALSEFESGLGVQLLLRRRAKGAVLTAAGVQALHQARVVLENAAALGSMAATMRGELTGPLRVGCFTPLSPTLIPPVVEFFAGEHPAVELEILEASADHLQERLLDGRLDVALMISARMRPQIEVTEVLRVPPRVLLAASHPLAGLPAVPMRDLAEERAILLSLHPVADLVEEMLRSIGVTPRVGWQVGNAETIRSLVSRGLGYGIALARPGEVGLARGVEVVYRPIAEPVAETTIVAAYPRGITPTAKVSTLIRRVSTGEDRPGPRPPF